MAEPLRPLTLRLIEEGHRYSAFYEELLSNHLPMALVALERMGASDARLEDFAARYEVILETVPEADAAEPVLGRPETFPAWVASFAKDIAARGAAAVTGDWVNRLLSGVGSTAFHGIIRLAYSLEIGSAAETAHALAQWAADYAPLGELPPPAASPISLDEALALVGDTRNRYPGRRIAAKMEGAAKDPAFERAVAAAGSFDLRDLARTALRAYEATGAFTLLHGVTACNAYRLLEPFVKDREAGLRRLWQALVCAAMSAGGTGAGTGLKGDGGLAWPEILKRAVESDDEHDVKIVYCCWREWQFYGDDAYRRAASASLPKP